MSEQLTPAEDEEFSNALCAAFPSEFLLEQMVWFRLNERLNEIVTSRANLRNQVFELIGWAHSKGRIIHLLHGACTHNPGNPHLLAFATRFGLDDRYALNPKPHNRIAREHPFPETWKCDLAMIEDCVEALDQPSGLFGFAVSCNYDAFRESFSKRLVHVLGRSQLDVVAPFTLSRLDTTDTVLKHADRMGQLKPKLQHRDLLCTVKLASDSPQIVAQQADVLWQSLHTAFQNVYDHRLILVLFTQVEFALPEGMIELASPRFKPVHVAEWIQDLAQDLGWEDHILVRWKNKIIDNSRVDAASPHMLHIELVYFYLTKSIQLLVPKPRISPDTFLEELF